MRKPHPVFLLYGQPKRTLLHPLPTSTRASAALFLLQHLTSSSSSRGTTRALGTICIRPSPAPTSIVLKQDRPFSYSAARQRQVGTSAVRHADAIDDDDENQGEGHEQEDKTDTIEALLQRDTKRRRERRDSLSEDMLKDRRRHLGRVLEQKEVDPQVLRRIKALGLGQKQKGKDTFKYRQGSKDAGAPPSEIGASGFATYLAAVGGGGKDLTDWPTFKHMLPEVAFAGHSNCGKSSLVNAVAGLAPKRGLARVSDRAGWTDAIFFYQLGKKPPVLTMADLPGYGHAVASTQQKRRWRKLTRDYLTTRSVLSLCCVLVDCVRGLCREDKDLLRFLKAAGVPTKLVLTKGDLLDAEALAKSHAVILQDIDEMGLTNISGTSNTNDENDKEKEGEGDDEQRERRKSNGSSSSTTDSGNVLTNEAILLVSASTGAGISALWKELVACTRKDAVYRGDIGYHQLAFK